MFLKANIFPHTYLTQTFSQKSTCKTKKTYCLTLLSIRPTVTNYLILHINLNGILLVIGLDVSFIPNIYTQQNTLNLKVTCFDMSK